MIRHTSFAHGWFYHYRHHVPKTQALCTSYPSLQSYIERMHDECPDEHFHEGPRSSKLRFALPTALHHAKGHEVCSLAKVGLRDIVRGTAHTKVQLLMLERDEKTIAVEVPLYLEHHELSGFEGVFGTQKPLSGHIDVLRIEDDAIWVWDYKPKAAKERFAATQVYFYALMLSIRTNIPLSKFCCGYFDEEDSYMFRPQQKSIHEVLSVCPLSVSSGR